MFSLAIAKDMLLMAAFGSDDSNLVGVRTNTCISSSDCLIIKVRLPVIPKIMMDTADRENLAVIVDMKSLC